MKVTAMDHLTRLTPNITLSGLAPLRFMVAHCGCFYLKPLIKTVLSHLLNIPHRNQTTQQTTTPSTPTPSVTILHTKRLLSTHSDVQRVFLDGHNQHSFVQIRCRVIDYLEEMQLANGNITPVRGEMVDEGIKKILN
eukprot:CAMPEP_0116017758 /NCGR_PEP_ID=MMETSP0321-20121206/8241_1 /TAXON_ID=163516 /ORGANISM="Leptocylindrus danicus var. danicus, Strain B650" /LENGTH=136 /DNA_ID=CAMNT_0003488017 /DNA_START=380 /DNA_END=790 /DNA_ORIENTATION=-